jgi:hypothetical protein
MRGRGLRGDIRQNNYGKILDADVPGARSALRDAAGASALTAFEHEQRERKRACKIFRSEGRAQKSCDRCGFDYPAHRAVNYGTA